jgi:hypothetical protein
LERVPKVITDGKYNDGENNMARFKTGNNAATPKTHFKIEQPRHIDAKNSISTI